MRYSVASRQLMICKVDRKALPAMETRIEGDRYQAPRDACEQQLVVIWESLLARRPVGIEDNFFELGGHSLLVVRLVSEITKYFGKHLPISRIFEFPTTSGIASLLRSEGNMPEASCIVTIRRQGSRAPLFILAGIDGMVSYLYMLAQHIDPKIPLYAFQARGLDGITTPHNSPETMAEHYVHLLLNVQPEGPYFLAGYSFGGKVAFAMAQLLLERGHAIWLLAIIDTTTPDAITGETMHALSDEEFLIEFLPKELGVSRADLEGLNGEQQMRFVAERLVSKHILPDGTSTESLRGMLNVLKANHAMCWSQYSPGNSRLQ